MDPLTKPPSLVNGVLLILATLQPSPLVGSTHCRLFSHNHGRDPLISLGDRGVLVLRQFPNAGPTLVQRWPNISPIRMTLGLDGVGILTHT